MKGSLANSYISELIGKYMVSGKSNESEGSRTKEVGKKKIRKEKKKCGKLGKK